MKILKQTNSHLNREVSKPCFSIGMSWTPACTAVQLAFMLFINFNRSLLLVFNLRVFTLSWNPKQENVFVWLKVLFSGLFLLQLECSGETAQLSCVSICIIMVPKYICYTTILLYVLYLENKFRVFRHNFWIRHFMKSFL